MNPESLESRKRNAFGCLTLLMLSTTVGVIANVIGEFGKNPFVLFKLLILVLPFSGIIFAYRAMNISRPHGPPDAGSYHLFSNQRTVMNITLITLRQMIQDGRAQEDDWVEINGLTKRIGELPEVEDLFQEKIDDNRSVIPQMTNQKLEDGISAANNLSPGRIFSIIADGKRYSNITINILNQFIQGGRVLENDWVVIDNRRVQVAEFFEHESSSNDRSEDFFVNWQSVNDINGVDMRVEGGQMTLVVRWLYREFFSYFVLAISSLAGCLITIILALAHSGWFFFALPLVLILILFTARGWLNKTTIIISKEGLWLNIKPISFRFENQSFENLWRISFQYSIDFESNTITGVLVQFSGPDTKNSLTHYSHQIAEMRKSKSHILLNALNYHLKYYRKLAKADLPSRGSR